MIVRPGTSRTVDAWNHTYNAAQGLVAIGGGGGWAFSWDAPLSAFDVLGCSKLCRVS